VSAARDPRHRRATYYKVPAPRRRWLGFLGWSLWAIAAVVTSFVVGAFLFLDDTLSEASPDTPEVNAAIAVTDDVVRGEPTNILLIGSDTRPSEGDPGRSDSLILVRVDPGNDYISMLSFPRDLWVDIPGYGQDKINAAFSLGGAKTTIETVKSLTDEPIHDYLLVDFNGFRSLVDQVGGVWIDVDRRYFNDNAGRAPGTTYAEIDIEPGYRRLKGDDALAYVRYRHTDSDFARIARQQQFLAELKRQTNKPDNLLRADRLSKIFKNNIQTSIRDVPKALELLRAALTIDKDRTARTSIDGALTMRDVGGQQVSVVVADPVDIADRVALWREPEFTAAGVNAVDPATTDVAVTNGVGRLLAAETASDLLREKGWNAHPAGNADSFAYSATEVRYAPGEREAARRIQRLMGDGARLRGLSPKQATRAPGEIEVVVGADFSGALAPPPKPAERPKPKTLDTKDLLPLGRRLGTYLGEPMMVPTKLAAGSSVRRVETYDADPGKGVAKTVKIVFEAGTQEYWGITATTLSNPAILAGRTGQLTRGGRRYSTYYDGRNMQRLAWKKDGVSYWISNSLDYALNAETMWAIAKSTREPAKAKLPKGATPTSVAIETDASTP
jgi:LCP family protein required for cell wall assembly